LNEGLAGYLSGKKFNYNQADKRKFLQIFSYFNRLDKEIYLVGQFWVEYLLKKFGRKKLLKLLNIFPSPMNQRQFTSKFSQIYNLKFNKSTFSKLIK